MKKSSYLILLGITVIITSCNKPTSNLIYENSDYNILFLHHSTGYNVWYGDIKPTALFYFKKTMCKVPRLVKEFNDNHGTKISIVEKTFPKGNPYPWANYPYDYYNIWIRNAGNNHFMEEPTLEILTRDYNMIIFKHCFPVSNIQPDDMSPDINSDKKTLANYELQYNALKKKLHEFPETKFIVWTGSALVEKATTLEEAKRAQKFADWVIEVWDQPHDNIYVYDFRKIETENGLYMKPEYSVSDFDSHPNNMLSSLAADQLVRKILEVFQAQQK